MSQRVWNEGEPPHIGWWLTKDRNNVERWCWWDGAFFLYYAQAKGNLVWSDYYPEGARVPRVDPALRENCAIVEFINISITSPDPKLWENAAWKDYHCKHAPARVGTDTPTVREMKERLKPMPTMHIPSTVPDREKVVVPAPPPGYVPGSRQRLSEAVRVGDVDFSGAMQRNTTPRTNYPYRDADKRKDIGHAHLRTNSNGQVQAAVNPERRETGDSFHGVNTMALLRELFRRFNAAP